jgi:hypothetical protein
VAIVTSVEVPSHRLVHPDPKAELALVENLVAVAVQFLHKKRTNLGSGYDNALRILGYRVALDNPQSDIVASLRSIVEFGCALFRRGSAGPDVTVTLSLQGTRVEIPGGVDYYNSAPRWVHAASAALVLRDSAALDSLCAFDPRAFEGDYDGYYDAHARALMALHRGEPDVAALLDEALHQAEKATIYPELGQRIAAPIIRVAQAVVAGDADAYNTRLAEGLTWYRTVYQRPDFNHEASNLLPLRYLALCALAHDRGLPCTVTSDYIPRWLVEGQFPPA